MFIIYTIPVFGYLLQGEPGLAFVCASVGVMNWDWIGMLEEGDEP